MKNVSKGVATLGKPNRGTATPAIVSNQDPLRVNRGHEDDFFEDVLDSIPFPQYLIRASDLVVIWRNSAARRADLPRNATCYSYIHGRSKPCAEMGRFCLLDQVRIQKGFVLGEETCVDKCGGTAYIESQGFPVFDGQGNLTHMLESRVDISPQRRAQQALYESEQKYRALFQEANDAIFLVDSDSGYIVNANIEAERLLGLPLDEILVMHQADLLNPSTMNHVKNEFTVQDHRSHMVDAQIVRRDGQVVPVCISSSEVSIHGRRLVQRVFKDMTEYEHTKSQLMRYQGELRSLASRLSSARERERRHIAARVHDSIGQTMAVCSMKLGALTESLASTPLVDDVREISRLVKQTIEETRTLAYQISSPLLYEVGLEAAVERLIEEMKEHCGIQFFFRHDDQCVVIDNETSVILFEGIRELLTNATNHSRAHSVQIQMQKKDDAFWTTVTDDGIGFDASQTAPGARIKGFGLFSIRERLESIGGRMIVKSKRGSGTRFILAIPLHGDGVTEGGDGNGHQDTASGRP